jgi:hypothetical protein
MKILDMLPRDHWTKPSLSLTFEFWPNKLPNKNRTKVVADSGAKGWQKVYQTFATPRYPPTIVATYPFLIALRPAGLRSPNCSASGFRITEVLSIPRPGVAGLRLESSGYSPCNAFMSVVFLAPLFPPDFIVSCEFADPGPVN